VKDTIGTVQTSVATRKETIVPKNTESTSQENPPQTHIFSEYFHSITNIEPESFLSSALAVSWRYFPKWGDVECKVGNADDPGDGMFYDNERVAKA